MRAIPDIKLIRTEWILITNVPVGNFDICVLNYTKRRLIRPSFPIGRSTRFRPLNLGQIGDLRT